MTKLYCNTCHNFTQDPQKKGNGWVELALYILYFVPGIIYSIWRRSGEPNVCPLCKTAGLIPANMAPSEKLNIEDAEDQLHWSERPIENNTTKATSLNEHAEPRDEIDCPYCAERILAKAKICKHCGKDVSPTT